MLDNIDIIFLYLSKQYVWNDLKSILESWINDGRSVAILGDMNFQYPTNQSVLLSQFSTNESANFGRLIPERRSITITCAAWGDWSPPSVPLCLRE